MRQLVTEKAGLTSSFVVKAIPQVHGTAAVRTLIERPLKPIRGAPTAAGPFNFNLEEDLDAPWILVGRVRPQEQSVHAVTEQLDVEGP